MLIFTLHYNKFLNNLDILGKILGANGIKRQAGTVTYLY